MSETRRRKPSAEILHMDGEILVVNKPSGVSSVPGRDEGTDLVGLLKSQGLIPSEAKLRVVHRLDRGASGVIVFARTLNAQRRLTEQFVKRRVEKVYLVLVQGIVSEAGEIDLPLRLIEDGTRAAVATQGGKASRTRYAVVEQLAGNTLLECRPLTGRLHQIRVHLAAIGHPLMVDPIYGGAEAVYLSHFKAGYHQSRRHEERPLIDRLTLHAARITIEHPSGSGPVTFEAPLPKDFRATLNQLRRV